MRRAPRKKWVPRFLFAVRSYGTIRASADFSESTRWLLTYKNQKSVAITDIDETLLFSTGYTSAEKKLGLGSTAWFMHTVKQLPAYAVLAYYFALQRYIHYVPTEECVPAELNMLKDNNIPILGLTARSVPISEITVAHLEKYGIRFAVKDKEPIVLDVSKKEEEYDAIYYKGIIFCSGRPKDVCFDAFLKTPIGAAMFTDVKHVSFMDDQYKHCEGMQTYLKCRGFFSTVVHYTYAEKNIPQATEEEIKEDMYRLAEREGLPPLGNRW